MQLTLEPDILPSRAEMERACLAHDASFDGLFFVAVKTTGVFCRPSCPAKPLLKNVEFFPSIRACCEAGYRPCKRCRPLESRGALPDFARQLIENEAISPAEVGVSESRARSFFLTRFGMSFSSFRRAQKMACAWTQLKNGDALEDAIWDNGYDSHSGFREAFRQTFGRSVGQIAQTHFVAVELVETPTGAWLVGATDGGICFFEPCDKGPMSAHLEFLSRQFAAPILPFSHPHIQNFTAQLAQYFAGKRRHFDVPLALIGSDFGREVWSALLEIPFGETVSYEELAHRIGKPTAVRAVARANASNLICVAIPCHRVIGKDENLTGYGGGLWRKRLLLEHEKRFARAEN